MASTKVARANPNVALSAGSSATGTNPCVVSNPGVVNGDLIIAVQSLKNTGTTASMTGASGFVVRGSVGGNSTNGYLKVWWTTANNEPSTWSFPKDADGVVEVLVVRNWDSRNGKTWDVDPTFNTAAAATAHVSPDITLLRSLDLQIRAFAGNTGGGNHNAYAPGTWVEAQDITVSGSNNLSVVSQASGGAGSPGTVTGTSTVSTVYTAVTFAIASPPDSDSGLYTPALTLGHWGAEDNSSFALIGANSTGADGSSACMVLSVVDDAHNVWQQGVTQFQAATNTDTAVRGAIWYCAGHKAFSKITVTMSETCDSLGVEIMEFTGITNVSPVDGTAGAGGSVATTTQNATMTTLAAADVVVALGVNGDSSQTTGQTVGTFTAGVGTTAVSTILADDSLALVTAYKITTSASAQSTTFTNSASAVLGWCILALKQGSVVTSNTNANWPAMTHELGFGSDPNDPAVTTAYTAVTTKVLSFAFQRGRDYELARTEAGEADVHLNNVDGRFDPTNTGSIYYPNVKVLTPYRCRALWNGDTYNIFTGYVERWPQKWEDDMRGTSRMLAIDGLATLAQTALEGAIGAEILADNPWSYWPLDDGRLADQAANKSTTKTTSLAIRSSTFLGGTAGFGYTMSLQSEDSTAWEQDRYTNVTGDASPASPTAIYGKCLGATMDLPQLASGVLFECWAKITPTSSVFNYTIIGLKATGFTALGARQVAILQMDSSTGLVTLYMADSSGVLTANTASVSGLNDSTFHHYVVHVTTTTARVWIDGTERVTATLASVPAATIDMIAVGGEVDNYVNQSIASGAQFAHVAVFQLATVDTRRIAARANAGLNGFPEKTGARISRILRYGGWAGPAAIDDGLSFLGATSTIPRQTLLAAVQDVASWENGLTFVDGSGNFRFVDRFDRFNQNIKYIFGGNTGELPYETDVEIDYDPRYVFNDVTVTRVLASTPGTGAVIDVSTGSSSARVKDQASIKSYFTRTLQKTSGVASIAQCTLEANWLIANYAQPRARLARISITPSANPTLWSVALGIEIGDRVLVRRQPFGGAAIELDCYVEQIGHQVKVGEWKTNLTLSPVLLSTYDGQSNWILDASTLNIDTIVGAP